MPDQDYRRATQPETATCTESEPAQTDYGSNSENAAALGSTTSESGLLQSDQEGLSTGESPDWAAPLDTGRPPASTDPDEARARLINARMRLGDLLSAAAADLQTRLADQAVHVTGPVLQALSPMFGAGAKASVMTLLKAAAAPAGPLGAIFSEAVGAKVAVEIGQFAAGSILPDFADPAVLASFFTAYTRGWQQSAFEGVDRALATKDVEGTLLPATEMFVYMAYEAQATMDALTSGMLVPLLQAAVESGAGRQADGGLTLYNVSMAYPMKAGEFGGRLTFLGLPVGLAPEDQELLMDLPGVTYQLACQLTTDDGLFSAAVAPNRPAQVTRCDPSIAYEVQLAGSRLTRSELDAIRLTAQQDPDRDKRAHARDRLTSFENEAADLQWAQIQDWIGQRSLRDLGAKGAP